MDAGLSAARKARTQHRHELRTLTYVTLDQANGGIVRNLSDEGIGVQVVAAVRPRQQLSVRFELRDPRLRVEAQGEVVWATSSGQCGIQFLGLSPRTIRLINEWIFGDLLEGASLHSDPKWFMFSEASVVRSKPDGVSGETSGGEEDDGLMISAAPLKVIELPAPREKPEPALDRASETVANDSSELDWLSQPLSGRGLAWTVNTLVVAAALLLFVLVFLSVTREAPRWPLAMTGGAALFVAGMYWGFFQLFGGGSLGERLARMSGSNDEDEEEEEERDSRFR